MHTLKQPMSPQEVSDYIDNRHPKDCEYDLILWDGMTDDEIRDLYLIIELRRFNDRLRIVADGTNSSTPFINGEIITTLPLDKMWTDDAGNLYLPDKKTLVLKMIDKDTETMETMQDLLNEAGDLVASVTSLLGKYTGTDVQDGDNAAKILEIRSRENEAT